MKQQPLRDKYRLLLPLTTSANRRRQCKTPPVVPLVPRCDFRMSQRTPRYLKNVRSSFQSSVTSFSLLRCGGSVSSRTLLIAQYSTILRNALCRLALSILSLSFLQQQNVAVPSNRGVAASVCQACSKVAHRLDLSMSELQALQSL
jgi:hypothetical protein